MCVGEGGDEARGAPQDGARPGNGEPSVVGGRTHRGRERAAGKGGSSEAEYGRGGERMGMVTAMIREKSEQSFFLFFLTTRATMRLIVLSRLGRRGPRTWASGRSDVLTRALPFKQPCVKLKIK